MSLNKGQATCGEAGLTTEYGPDTGGARTFAVQSYCVANWEGDAQVGRPRPRGAPVIFELNLTGTVAAVDDAAVPNATYFSWVLGSAAISPPDALGSGGLRTLDIAGFEALSLHALPPAPGCFYTPDMNGVGESAFLS